jgi:hypothetical protein
MEKIKRDKNRVNISSIKTTDSTGDALTGGYILKIDKVNGSPAWSWKNTIGTPSVLFQVEYPKYADLTSKQLTYIKGWMTTFEKELYANTALEKDAAWRNMIDMDSFVDYFILTELTKNIDGYRLSTYFYKDKDSKDARLKMGQLGITTWLMAMLIIMKDTKLQVGNTKSTLWLLPLATFICLLFGGQARAR